MMKRRRFGALTLSATGSLLPWPGCAWAREDYVTDDGVMEIRPQFLVNYRLGERTMRVKGLCDSLALRKVVMLGPNGQMRVNGVRLTREDGQEWYEYGATVPAESPTLRFELIRTSDRRTTVEIALPTYRIAEYPKTFKYPEHLILRMATPLNVPAQPVVQDDFGMDIQSAGSAICAFVQHKEATHADPTLVLRPIRTKIYSFPSGATAKLIRLQRTALKDVTTDYPAGWVVVTVSHQFPIDVLEP
jgi:hypothetical protein